MTAKYGFIYVWYDCKHNRYYIGRHWGTEDDGYVCSQANMRNNKTNRPYDFKRRIVSRVYDKDQLVIEEQRWLDMIKAKIEAGFNKKRYYNQNLNASTPSMRGRKHSEETKRKMSEAAKGRKLSDKTKERVRQANLGKKYSTEVNAKKGRAFSEERKAAISAKMKEHYRNNSRSVETRKKISENSKRLHKEGRIGRKKKNLFVIA